MSPELHIFGLNLVFFAIAYLVIYPRVEPKTLGRLVLINLVLIVVLLGIAGSVYYGTGTQFSLVLFDTKWWVFTLVCAVVVETPLFLWFCKRWDIDLNGDD